VKRARSDDGNSSKDMFEGQGRPSCKRRLSNQVSFSYPRVKNDRVPNPKPQGGMSVQEYSLKFTNLSKYAPSLVSNPRDEMSRFVMGVSDSIEKECRAALILHDNMDISRLMVYAQ